MRRARSSFLRLPELLSARGKGPRVHRRCRPRPRGLRLLLGEQCAKRARSEPKLTPLAVTRLAQDDLAMRLDEPGVVLTAHESLRLADAEQEARVRVYSGDAELEQSATQPGDGLGAIVTSHHELGEQGIVM